MWLVRKEMWAETWGYAGARPQKAAEAGGEEVALLGQRGCHWK